MTPRHGQASVKKYKKHFTGSSAFPMTSRRQIWNRNCSYSPCGPCPTRRGRFCEQQWPGCKLDVRFEVEHLIYTFSSLVSVEAHRILLLENQVLQCQLNLIHSRVGKCHGYDGYIRVKKLANWGKKFGRPKWSAKTSHFGEDMCKKFKINGQTAINW